MLNNRCSNAKENVILEDNISGFCHSGLLQILAGTFSHVVVSLKSMISKLDLSRINQTRSKER